VSTTRVLALRALPPSLLGTKRAKHLVERNFLVYRHTWLIIVSGFFEPVFYLLSIRVGIGHLVGNLHIAGRAVSYAVFAAPALLASSAMNGAIYESTMNIFHKLRYARVYDAVLSTPVGPRDVALGEISFCLLRGAAYSTAFLAVMLIMGLVRSWWAVLVLPAAVLVGFAFAAVGMATTTYMRSWQDFDFVQVAILPLFLLSATFYPLSTYPAGLRWLVQLTPLYQAVALIRALTLGTVGPTSALHALYLLVMGLTGLAVAGRRVGQLLLR
jgi:lipooligosaccharide transport system permease protein